MYRFFGIVLQFIVQYNYDGRNIFVFVDVMLYLKIFCRFLFQNKLLEVMNEVVGVEDILNG